LKSFNGCEKNNHKHHNSTRYLKERNYSINTMTKAKEITGENFEEDVLNSETFVLVDFWAPWCQPCLMMAPTLDELSEELEGKVKIVKVDVENQENQELAMKYQIQSIPNMKLFKGGEFVKEIVGLKSKEALKSELDEIIN